MSKKFSCKTFIDMIQYLYHNLTKEVKMEHEKVKKKKISKKRRTNAILYPIYKMFSWDLLCFYSIEFLFYTITKGISASQVLILTSLYILFKVIFQIPSVAIADYFGKRKSMILGNGLLVIYQLILIFSPNFLWMVIANIFCGFGYDLKLIAEGNLLYDSVATRGGDGIYTKIDSRGASGYYILNTVLAVISGYLFVINNYIPMYICLLFLVISFILSFRFKDIYTAKDIEKKQSFSAFLKGYSNDIRDSFEFIKKSSRMKAYLIFATVFYGLIKVFNTYKNDLLTDMSVTEEQFSMIYAMLSLVAAISVTYSKKIQKQFKNKTLTVLSLSYILSMVFVGIISLSVSNYIGLPFIIILYGITRISDSQWYVTEYTYLRNFTTAKSRNKITFTFELITCLGASIMSFLGAIILDYLNIRYVIIIVSLLLLAITIIVLDYMKTRIGLKPSQYKKEDLEFTQSKEK